jgi:predicted transcriptional regulator
MDRSQNWLITQALEGYVDLYDWQVEEIKKSVKKADNGGKFYTHEEVSTWLESLRP